MSQPGGDRGFGFRLQIRIFQTSSQVCSSLLDDRMETAELVQGLAEDRFAFLRGGLGIDPAAVVEQLGVAM